jgi:X-X-X-Leu-X-X-Gly heptad repeat protein
VRLLLRQFRKVAFALVAYVRSHRLATSSLVIVGAKSLNNGNGQLEDGIAEITAALGGEHRSAAE